MKKRLLVFLFSVLFLGGLFSQVGAQEADDGMFSFGQVVTISGQELTIREYDFEKDADVDIVYEVTDATEYGNVTSISDLAEFDSVVFDYTEKNGKKWISTLVKEEVGVDTESFEDSWNSSEEYMDE